VLAPLFGLPEVPVVDEPVQAIFQPVEGAGKGEGFATQVAHALAERVVGSFDFACFSPGVFVSLEAAAVLERRLLEQRLIHPQAVGEHQAVAPGRGHLLPQRVGALQVARADKERYDLQCAPGQHNPHPRLLRFATDERPQLIYHHFVPRTRAERFDKRRQLVYFFWSKA